MHGKKPGGSPAAHGVPIVDSPPVHLGLVAWPGADSRNLFLADPPHVFAQKGVRAFVSPATKRFIETLQVSPLAQFKTLNRIQERRKLRPGAGLRASFGRTLMLETLAHRIAGNTHGLRNTPDRLASAGTLARLTPLLRFYRHYDLPTSSRSGGEGRLLQLGIPFLGAEYQSAPFHASGSWASNSRGIRGLVLPDLRGSASAANIECAATTHDIGRERRALVRW